MAKRQTKKSKKSLELFYFKHKCREALIKDNFDDEGPHVLDVLNEYMDKDTDLYDSEDLNEAFDYVLTELI